MNADTEKKAVIYIDPELHRLAKIEAAKAGLPLGKYVDQLIHDDPRAARNAATAKKENRTMLKIELDPVFLSVVNTKRKCQSDGNRCEKETFVIVQGYGGFGGGLWTTAVCNDHTPEGVTSLSGKTASELNGNLLNDLPANIQTLRGCLVK